MDVRMPDGTIIRNVSEGTTKAQLQAKLTRLHEQRGIRQAAIRTRQKKPETGIGPIDWVNRNAPAVGDFMSGIGASTREMVLGAKDLFTDLSEPEKAELIRADTVRGGAATAGRMAADVAMLAAPGGAVARGAKYAPKILTRTLGGQRGLTAAGDVAASAGMEYIRAPGEGESRTRNAAQGALGAAVGGAAAGAVGKYARGIRRSPQAQQLLQDNVPLTPGQAASGRMAPAAEQVLATTPGAARQVARLQQESADAWSQRMLQAASPNPNLRIPPGQEGVKALEQAFREAYEQVWSRPIQMQRDLADDFGSIMRQATETLPGKLANRVGKTLDEAYQTFAKHGSTPPGRAIDSLDTTLREAARLRGKKYPQEAQFYQMARERLRAAMPEGVQKFLQFVDGQFARFAAVRRAAGYKGRPASQGGNITPDDLARGSRNADKRVDKMGTATGNAPMQREAAEAAAIYDGYVPTDNSVTSVLNQTRQVMRMLPLANPVTTEPMRQIMLGLTPHQRRLLLMSEAIRNPAVRGTIVGGAATGELIYNRRPER